MPEHVSSDSGCAEARGCSSPEYHTAQGARGEVLEAAAGATPSISIVFWERKANLPVCTTVYSAR